MSVYRRGGKWWFEFEFEGQRIRESARTPSKTIAEKAERQRRRELELGINRIPERKRTPLFKLAADEWLATKRNLSRFTSLHYRQYVASLGAEFADRLICDIRLDDLAKLQQKRQAQALGNRTVNAEIQVLRQILKHFGLWANLQGRIRFLREPRDSGRALSHDDEAKLLEAAGLSRSPALLPRLVLALDSGIRANEMRQLRQCDLTLTWCDGAIQTGWLKVSRSKTEGGTGRTIPLSNRTCAILTLWLSRFPSAPADGYLFPRHMTGFASDKRKPFVYAVDFSRPSSEWKSAWVAACHSAGVRYRWHDLRHTFVSRLAENPLVSEQTIMALAGHVSKSMLARYSHIRSAAKQVAIDALEAWRTGAKADDFESASPQNPPQSSGGAAEPRFAIPEKSLN
jgi:integrase